MCDPRPPEEPLPTDCCNSGCTPCILDVYKDLLTKWEKECILHSDQETSEILPSVGSADSVLCPTKFTCFKVKYVKTVCQDTVMLCFQAVKKHQEENTTHYYDTNHPLDFQPGQYLILQGSNGDNLFSRPYTPVSDRTTGITGSFEVIVKLYPHGQMSQYFSTLTPGDITLWRGPYGNFTYKRNTFTHILMLCAGTGIAPLYSIANSIVHDDLDDTIIKMLFCCRDMKNIIHRSALHALSLYWNFNIGIYLSHESETNCKPFFGETLKTVRINEDIIASELQQMIKRTTHVLICGGSGFCREMDGFVNQCGLIADQVHIFS